jgi:hypothetical protein
MIFHKLQKIFTDSSKLLFTATKNYLYFKKIKVIVPKTWQHKEKYKKARIPSHIEQKILIDNTKQDEKGTPRVYGIPACGTGGSYMYLHSEKFILKTGQTSWGLHGMYHLLFII